jgi:hypothetical protein
MNEPLVESIDWSGRPLAYVIRRQLNPEKTSFLTPSELNLQVGFVVYRGGQEIPRHTHRALDRTLHGTSEVLMLKQGRCLVDIYNDDKELVATRELVEGDLLFLVAGGHGFRVIEDTVFIEIKQGPYFGVDEKERF